MKLVDLTLLILELSALIDSGAHEGTTIDDVEQHIADGDLFPWLAQRFSRLDLSLHRGRSDREINDGLNDILGGYAGQERRKWGIENNGICLLLSWTNELIQQRKFID
ncbi:hypothetical protein U1839_05960 [Sphingomonas sp. RT2P30]|uniref:hypothetical protein n=1 Tax=Parasphingomonas halimpatiens TaxID=3096162 RepID=UPI002FCC090C